MNMGTAMNNIETIIETRQLLRQAARHWWQRRSAAVARQLRRRGRY
jgi:hypothetical protein